MVHLLPTSLPADWVEFLSSLKIAYQPIFEVSTSKVFGYTSSFTGTKSGKLSSRKSIYDEALRQGLLHQVEQGLRRRAITRCRDVLLWGDSVLFLHCDSRLGLKADYRRGETKQFLGVSGVSLHQVVLEIGNECGHPDERVQAAREYRMQGYQLALELEAPGGQGVKEIIELEPEFVKLSARHTLALLRPVIDSFHRVGSRVVLFDVDDQIRKDRLNQLDIDFAAGDALMAPRFDFPLAFDEPAVRRLMVG